MGQTSIKPVFILSLPRAGSTLLQRILASHPRIATTAEPWIALPVFYNIRDRGYYADFDHRTMARAIGDFLNKLPAGKSDYEKYAGQFLLNLYSAAADKDAAWFLDKTPRYHLVARELIRAFPEGRFIILWRHPLAVAASMISTWGSGRWILHQYYQDLYSGVENLLEISEEYREKVFTLQYENLVRDPEDWTRKICAYLELDYSKEMLERFGDMEFSGKRGDQTGTERYDGISGEPLEKWKKVMVNPVRRRWCRKYLRWIGSERLRKMGYDPDILQSSLSDLRGGLAYLASDLMLIPVNAVFNLIGPGKIQDRAAGMIESIVRPRRKIRDQNKS